MTFQANFKPTGLFLIFKFILHWYLGYFKCIGRAGLCLRKKYNFERLFINVFLTKSQCVPQFPLKSL